MSRPEKTKEYDITWRIQLSARSPREAAELALEIQRDNGSYATVFRVTDPDTRKTVTVDLEEAEAE